MSVHRTSRTACLGMLFPLLVGGCSGGDPPPSPTPQPVSTTAASVTATPSASGTPSSSGTPSASLTPDVKLSPLGGKPASESEIAYYGKKKEAEDLALARNYAKAIPIFEQLHAENPEDVDVMFYLMLSHGSTEEAPSKKSPAFAYAEKVVASDPDSRQAGKARSYINAANLTLPDKFKYGEDSMLARGGWVLSEDASYKTVSDLTLHTAIQSRLVPADQAILWDTEASPATSSGTEKLPKGSQVKVLTVKDFLYSLTSWRKAIPADTKTYDKTMFDVSAMYVEVLSDGPLKGKKGWIVNHVDRYIGTPEMEWGSWISNRLKVLREADLETASPAP